MTPETMTAIIDAGPVALDAAAGTAQALTAAASASLSASAAPGAPEVSGAPMFLEWILSILGLAVTALVPILARWLLAKGTESNAFALSATGCVIQEHAEKSILLADAEAAKAKKADAVALTGAEKLDMAIRDMTTRLADAGIKVSPGQLRNTIEATKRLLDYGK